MEKIIVFVSANADEVTYAILPDTKRWILNNFPKAHPASTLNLNYIDYPSFESLHQDIRSNIIFALLGIPQLADISKLPAIQFMDAQNGKTVDELVLENA